MATELETPHEFITIVCTFCNATFKVPKPCGNRFCTVCNQRRKRIAREKLNGVIHKASLSKGYNFRHLILSTANQPDLAESIQHLIKSFRRLRQRSYWKNHVDGGVFVIEVTGNPGNWHPHLHIILSARYMKHSKLLQLWNHVSGGTGCYIKTTPKNACINYITKYITKTSLTGDSFIILNNALRGLRLFNFFGTWHGLANSIKIPRCVCPLCFHDALEVLDFLTPRSPSRARTILASINDP